MKKQEALISLHEYTIIPAESYRIADVIADNASAGAVGIYKLDHIQKAHTIAAVFEKNPWMNPFRDINKTSRQHRLIRKQQTASEKTKELQTSASVVCSSSFR